MRGSLYLKRHYQDYTRNAKKSGWEWKLTKRQFKIITQKPCTYCGAPPKPRLFRRHNKDCVSVEPLNGIDRIDPKRGYVKGNVTPCCIICNRLKSSFPLAKFLDQVAAIAKHMKLT